MRRLLVLVLVLGVLAVVADRGAAYAAERLLASQAQTQLGTRPSVSIGGVPFLTQVASGTYDDVTLSAPSVVRDGLRLETVRGTLHGVHAPVRSLLGGSLSSVPVDALAFTAVVPFGELQRLAADQGVKDLTVRSTGRADEVQLTASLTVLGQSLSATAVSGVSLKGGRVALAARSLQIGGVTAPLSLTRSLSDRLDLSLPLPSLPYGIALSSLSVTSTGVAVQGSGRDVVLRR